jgi:hypothetical protein
MLDYAVPDIDEGIPLPSRATEALPPLSPREEMEMRARTVKLLAEINDIPLIPSEQDKAQARELVKQVNANPDFQPDYDKYPNEVMAHLGELIAQSSYEIVEDLSNLKHYIVNKLVYEIEYSKSSKDRIAALSKLGEIDGVDAFKSRTETTIKVLPIEEVERKLLNILDNIEYTVVENQNPDFADNLQNVG